MSRGDRRRRAAASAEELARTPPSSDSDGSAAAAQVGSGPTGAGSAPPPGPATYLGLFLLSLATLIHEIVLTRIFSVTMWYHFAFVAISVAMFGLTIGALIVYLRPAAFARTRLARRMAESAWLFSVSAVASLLLLIGTPVGSWMSSGSWATSAIAYAVVAGPFVASGVGVCLALTRYPARVGSLYAADLAGAAAGCLLVIPLLAAADGPTAIVAASSIASLAAVFFAAEGPGPRAEPDRPAETGAWTAAPDRWLRFAPRASAALFLLFAIANAALVRRQDPLLRLSWVKGAPEPPPLYEAWNSFSRITVSGDPSASSAPRGWGLSVDAPDPGGLRQLMLLIDASAGTVLTSFDGDASRLDYLKYDVTNLPHHLRRDARVLVVGAGGGRDVLSALAFSQRSVLAVEVNPAILRAVNGRFGEFTGHLDRDPRVRFVEDEARSYLARQTNRFDVIQLSLIDTWAATAAGAFALTENGLYTVEAFDLFLARLAPRGLLSVSRFYNRGAPVEFYRLTALAAAALGRGGVADPRSHIVIVARLPDAASPGAPVGMGTMLVGRDPLSAEDLDALEAVSSRMGFEIVLGPRRAADETLGALAGGGSAARATIERFPFDIAPPTDDRPFFFQTLRLKDAFGAAFTGPGAAAVNLQAVKVLGALLAAVGSLTVLCVFVPLLLTLRGGAGASTPGIPPSGGGRAARAASRRPRTASVEDGGVAAAPSASPADPGDAVAALPAARLSELRAGAPLFGYFAAIGFGFILIEISQMQRLTILLGPPAYSLTVVLLALLASSGLGSFASRRFAARGWAGAAPLAGLTGLLVLFGLLTPAAIREFAGSTTPARVLLAAALVAPPGLLMGTAFPLGMRIGAERAESLTAWLWGINGAASVTGSVLAVAIALSFGISFAFWTGALCYALAAVALGLATRTGWNTP